VKRQGRPSKAQTPAPRSERIKGSSVNKEGSAASKKSAKSIKLSSEVISVLEKKKDDYNEKHTSKVNIATLKAVFRRGAGAYSSSHRPTISGGKPNSRTAWAFARVNKFLKKKSGESVKKAYVQDDDLMAEGGEIPKRIHCFNCEEAWYSADREKGKEFICPNCREDNWKYYEKNDILFAPNGRPSKLTPEQYKLVRTPEFKAWFGDWEKGWWEGSMVKDHETGEPLVVYHGSPHKFNVFDIKKVGTQNDTGYFGTGFYFGVEPQYMSRYGSIEKGTLKPYFLNVRKLFVYSSESIIERFDPTPLGFAEYLYLDELLYDDYPHGSPRLNKTFSDAVTNKIRDEWGMDGIEIHSFDGWQFVVYEPNQIKLADGTNTTFNPDNPDIRFQKGGKLKDSNMSNQMKHNQGSAGGYLVGNRHSNGGIKAVNKSNGQPLEMEGGEVVITRNAVNDETKREFNGKMMTNKEILSAINVSGGGVSFEDGGKVPECTCSGRRYKYGGKIMKDYEIIEEMRNQYPSDFKKGIGEEMSEHEDTFKMLVKRKLTPKQAAERVVAEHLQKKPDYYDNYENGGHIDIMGRKIVDYDTFQKGGMPIKSPYVGESEDYYRVYHPIKRTHVYAKGGNVRRAFVSPLIAYKNFLHMVYDISFNDLPNKIKNALLMGKQNLVDSYIK